jgi:hypothetical protein
LEFKTAPNKPSMGAEACYQAEFEAGGGEEGSGGLVESGLELGEQGRLGDLEGGEDLALTGGELGASAVPRKVPRCTRSNSSRRRRQVMRSSLRWKTGRSYERLAA